MDAEVETNAKEWHVEQVDLENTKEVVEKNEQKDKTTTKEEKEEGGRRTRIDETKMRTQRQVIVIIAEKLETKLEYLFIFKWCKRYKNGERIRNKYQKNDL